MGLCEESWWSMVFFKSWALRVRSVCATLPISIHMRSSSWSWDEWHWSTCGRKHWIPIILAGTMANICGCARHCAWRFLLYHPVSSHSPLGRWGCQLWSSVLCPCWSEADAVWVRQLCYESPEYPLVLVPPCVHDRIKNCLSASSISSLPSYFSKHYGRMTPTASLRLFSTRSPGPWCVKHNGCGSWLTFLWIFYDAIITSLKPTLLKPTLSLFAEMPYLNCC